MVRWLSTGAGRRSEASAGRVDLADGGATSAGVLVDADQAAVAEADQAGAVSFAPPPPRIEGALDRVDAELVFDRGALVGRQGLFRPSARRTLPSHRRRFSFARFIPLGV